MHGSQPAIRTNAFGTAARQGCGVPGFTRSLSAVPRSPGIPKSETDPKRRLPRRAAKVKDNHGTLTVASLFAGAGGIDLGLIQAGLRVVWAVDNNPDCVATYQANIGDHIICEDIANVKSCEIPSVDVIVGGFPCQGFSLANRFRSGTDGRNQLYREMLRIIVDKQPKWFVAENVRGILSLEGGGVFERIIEDFRMAGYRVRHDVVNMADHGVPQIRKRVILLATRRDLPEEMTATHPSPSYAKSPLPGRCAWRTMNQALSELGEAADSLPNSIGSSYKLAYRNFTGHRPTDGDKPSPTILARGNGKGGVCAIPHPQGLRRLTVRESAAVQTFPNTFEFIGSVGSAYRQVGNAVPVVYGKMLGGMFQRVARA